METDIDFILQYNLWSYELIQKLIPEDGIDGIIKTGYEMLGNPIYIADLSSDTVAITSNYDIKDDPVWDEFLNKGYLSYHSHEFYSNNNHFIAAKNSKMPYFWRDSYTKYRKIISPIMADDKQIGIMAVVEYEKEFCDSDLKLVSLLCDAISVQLQKNSVVHYLDGKIYKSILKDMLSGKISIKEEVEEKRKVLKIPAEAYLYIMTIDIGEFSDRSNNSLLYWSRVVEPLVSNGKTVVYEDYIILFVSSVRPNRFFDKNCLKLKELIDEKQMKVGISRCFHSLEELRENYSQSVYALKLGRLMDSKKNTFLYEDYAAYKVVEACLNAGDLKKYCHPSLLALIEYDKKNNTAFEQTLSRFIYHTVNVPDTAKDLHIHRNTLLYRIEKISEIMNVDLSNSNILLQLHFSLKLINFLRINSKDIPALKATFP